MDVTAFTESEKVFDMRDQGCVQSALGNGPPVMCRWGSMKTSQNPIPPTDLWSEVVAEHKAAQPSWTSREIQFQAAQAEILLVLFHIDLQGCKGEHEQPRAKPKGPGTRVHVAKFGTGTVSAQCVLTCNAGCGAMSKLYSRHRDDQDVIILGTYPDVALLFLLHLMPMSCNSAHVPQGVRQESGGARAAI